MLISLCFSCNNQTHCSCNARLPENGGTFGVTHWTSWLYRLAGAHPVVTIKWDRERDREKNHGISWNHVKQFKLTHKYPCLRHHVMCLVRSAARVVCLTDGAGRNLYWCVHSRGALLARYIKMQNAKKKRKLLALIFSHGWRSISVCMEVCKYAPAQQRFCLRWYTRLFELNLTSVFNINQKYHSKASCKCLLKYNSVGCIPRDKRRAFYVTCKFSEWIGYTPTEKGSSSVYCNVSRISLASLSRVRYRPSCT